MGRPATSRAAATLDECKELEGNAISTILHALSEYAGRLLPLMFFITSRPVPNVVLGFHEMGLMSDTSMLILHNIPSDMAERDIRIYLEERFSDITRIFSPPSSWHSKADFTTLVKLSDGLFIFAATAARYIADRGANNPEGQLAHLMSATYIGFDSSSPHRQLDKLYLQVLYEAFPSISQDQRARLKMVLGTIVLLLDPLSSEHLAALLAFTKNDIPLTLLSLHSMVIVPNTGGGSIRLIHPLSHDFLIDADRCNNTNFTVNAQIQHTILAEHCL
jgi:hypothetical protein